MNEQLIKVNKSKINNLSLCGFCGKTFKKKRFYEKHILLCEQIEKNKIQEKVIIESNIKMPSQEQLYLLLMDMTHKYNTIQQELNLMRRYIHKSKKKINILEWMKNNCNSTMDYSVWKKTITISDVQLYNLFDNGYINGVYSIIESSLSLDTVHNHPIRCFDQKKHIFFTYENGDWSIMDQNDITNLIRFINKLIMKKFLEWKENNNEKIQQDDRFHDKYVDYMRIVLGGGLTKEQSNRRIINKIYNYLKCDLKNIIEYEFVF